jgi:hypothetical protein
MAAPTTFRWATAQTDPDATKVAPSSGELDQGYHTDEVPTASKFNYLLNLIGLWFAYIVNVFAGTETIAGLKVSSAGVKHGTRTRVIDLATCEGGAIGWTSDGDLLSCLAATTGSQQVDLGLALGDRLLAVRLVCRSAGGAAGDVSLGIRQSVTTLGAASSGVSSDLVAAQNSLANANAQTVTATVASPAALTTLTRYRAQISAFSSAGVKSAMILEVDYDRP